MEVFVSGSESSDHLFEYELLILVEILEVVSEADYRLLEGRALRLAA